MSLYRCLHGFPLRYHTLCRSPWAYPFHIKEVLKISSQRGANSLHTTAKPASSLTRNIGIIAHIDAGKTTTTERMLYYSGFTRHIGDVDDGSTVTDFLPAERARGITIQSAAITFHWPPLPAGPAYTPNPESIIPKSSIPHTVNLIDTPGHADFTFEVLRSLRILDGAVCILDAVAGVEAQTEKVWNQASAYHIPRIIYVNKLDRDGAAFGKTVYEIAARLHAWPAVCQIPWWEDGNGRFKGVCDIVGLRALAWEEGGDGKSIELATRERLEVSEPLLWQEMKRARVALVELLSEHDDHMVENFLEHDEDHLSIPASTITDSLRRCVIEGSAAIVPVLAGASFRNVGVQPLLDAVVDLLPEPSERPDPDVTLGSTTGRLGELMEGKLHLDIPSGKAGKSKKIASATISKATDIVKGLESCSLAFKVVNDARRGVLVYVRVYAGSLTRNSLLFNTQLQVSERAPRLLRMYASDATEIESIDAGQIGVIAGLKQARTGDTLVSYTGVNPKSGPPAPLNTLQLRPIEVPPPVFFASIEPNSLSEEKHLAECLEVLLREDPSLQISVDEDSGQTLLSGMGELHLEIARDRLINDFHAKARVGRIEIGYRETLSAKAGPAHAIIDKEIAGRKAKAGCEASVMPLDRDLELAHEESDQMPDYLTLERDGNRVTVAILGLDDPDPISLPAHLSEPVIQTALVNGALAALSNGPRYFYPMHEVSVQLTFDPRRDLFGTSTTAAALTNAARQATRAAISQAASTSSSSSDGACLMEPVMTVHISVDEAHLGAVVHDLSASRGGQVLSLSSDDAASSTASPSERIPLQRIYAPPDPFAARTSPSTSSSSESTGLNYNHNPAVGAHDNLVQSQHGQQRTITARVPLKEMVGYLKHLRSLTGGRGTFVMAVDRFERMSRQRERAVVAEMRGV